MKKLLSLCLAALAVAGPPAYARRVVNAPAVMTTGEGRALAPQAERTTPPKAPPAGATSPNGPQEKLVRGPSHDKAAAAAFELGVKLGRAGRYEEAAGAFEEAVLYQPDHPDAHFNLGHALYDTGRWAEAAAAFQRAAALDPKDIEAVVYLGASFFRRGLYDQAVEAYKKALLLKPTLGDVRYNIANAFFKLRRYEPALLYYKEAGYFKPKSSELFNDMGVAYAEWGRYEEAAEFFERALGRNSDDAYAQNNLGLSYFFLGRPQEGAKAFERATRLAPQDAVIRRNAEVASGRLARGGVAVGDRVSLRADAGASRDVRWMGRSDVIRGIRESAAPTRVKGEQGAAETANTPTGRDLTPTPPPAAREASAAPAPRPKLPTTTDEPAPAAPDPGPPAGAPPALTEVYRVGVGDVLDIRLLDDTSKSSTLHTVLSGGLVEYAPLGSPFEAAGMTTAEIAAHIKSELQRRDANSEPRVVVSVRDYASHTIIVSGLVRDPGVKLLRREAVPLYVIIADAQPLPEAGRVLVMSYASGQKTEIALDDQAAMSALIGPGDIINVLGKQQHFYFIGGKVTASGQKEFHSGITLTQAILAAGGTLNEGKTALVTRQNADGLLAVSKHNLKEIMSGSAPDPALQPGDRIEVIR